MARFGRAIHGHRVDIGGATRLVITETSVARALGAALGNVEERDGYLIAGDTVLAFTIGFPVEFSMPEGRLPQISDLDALQPRRGQEQHVGLLSTLLHDERFVTVVNACSASELGELIFRTLLRFLDHEPPSIVRLIP